MASYHRDHTETFAHHLTCRLKSLGAQMHKNTMSKDDTFLDDLENNAWLPAKTCQNKKQPLSHDIPPVSYINFNCEILDSIGNTEEDEVEEDTDQHLYDNDYIKCVPLIVNEHSLHEENLPNGLYNLENSKKVNASSTLLVPSNETNDACRKQNLTDKSSIIELLQQNEVCKEDDRKVNGEQFTILKNGYSNETKQKKVMDNNENIAEETISETVKRTAKNDHQYSDDNEEDDRPERVRRCSSLKTGKTPPGTPSCKKIVRFADALGLDLADIKTYLDDIPTIPRSAYEDLQYIEAELPTYRTQNTNFTSRSCTFLMPLFQQPISLPNFIDIVKEKFVVLENAIITDSINNTITGCVRVRNLDFHKSVHIRYSIDGWRSHIDLRANYLENSCDGFSDKFLFTLYANTLQRGQRLEFAVRFQCKGQQYWDNNYGTNYCFQCLSRSIDDITATNANTIRSNGNLVNSLTKDSHNILNSLDSIVMSEAWCTSFY